MSESSDWIRLLVKYKGKCAECSKEIPAGEYALWSRNTKAIKHIQCEEGHGTSKAKKRVSTDLDCFICGKAAGCTECGFEADCKRAVISQACICNNCMKEKNAYSNYQQAFLEKIRKLVKVKI
jgi:hypothetical protein